VLQLKGEKELALKIYERGLNKVKIGVDKDRTVSASHFYQNWLLTKATDSSGYV